MKISNFLKLITAIVVSELAGIIGSIFTFQAIPTWYATINRPTFSPPNWLFGPVWTTLYALMGVAVFIVWQHYSKSEGEKRHLAKVGLVWFVIQLVLNAFWPIIFFGLKNPGLAFIEIIILWLAILMTIISFAKISKSAAWLLAPYIAWVSFASILNYAIWMLN